VNKYLLIHFSSNGEGRKKTTTIPTRVKYSKISRNKKNNEDLKLKLTINNQDRTTTKDTCGSRYTDHENSTSTKIDDITISSKFHKPNYVESKEVILAIFLRCKIVMTPLKKMTKTLKI
jgi:hypothetical protein